jgi:hypothetical protein
MIPKKLALGHRSEGGPRFPACAKPGLPLVTPVYASAGEARSEKIMLGQQAKAKYRNSIALGISVWAVAESNWLMQLERNPVDGRTVG